MTRAAGLRQFNLFRLKWPEHERTVYAELVERRRQGKSVCIRLI